MQLVIFKATYAQSSPVSCIMYICVFFLLSLFAIMYLFVFVFCLLSALRSFAQDLSANVYSLYMSSTTVQQPYHGG